MAEKGPKKFSRFMRRGTRGGQADNGQKRQPGIKWQSGIKMAEKGPKKLSRFMRHFPTTIDREYSKKRLI